MGKHKLYILLSHTGSLASKCINIYTKAPYTHVSIALDVHLKEIYSFGRLKPHNPIIGGFVKEDIEKGTYNIFPDTRCALYSIDISEKQYNRFKKELDRFIYSDCKFGYNYLGIIGFMLKKPIRRKYAYFCSQFVAEVLYKSGIRILDKEAGLTSPNDFSSCQDLQLIYEGNLHNYKTYKPAASY